MDIVKQLRDQSEVMQGEAWRRTDGGQNLCLSAKLADEAADEIERLNGIIGLLEVQHNEDLGAKLDEIERLRDLIRRSADMLDDAYSGYIPGSGTDEGWCEGKERLLADLRAHEQNVRTE